MIFKICLDEVNRLYFYIYNKLTSWKALARIKIDKSKLVLINLILYRFKKKGKKMKKIFKMLLVIVVSLMTTFMVTVDAVAINDINKEERLISEILTYFSYSEGDFNKYNGWSASVIKGDIDIQQSLNELKEVNPLLGEAFSNIMDYWIYADTSMPINLDVLPDGLPNDNSLCIVTLGFQLDQETGEMQPELIKRLEVTLLNAIKYPNAYIAVTGGGTSLADPSKTEGEEMAKWLIAHGVDEKRIIVENKAPTTVGNATNTFRLLKEKPEVKSIAMISSSSHIQRAVAIFEAVFQLEAYRSNCEAINILSNASCLVERQEKLSQQLASVSEAINTCLGSNVKLIDGLNLSTLEYLEIANVNDKYEQGSKIEPKIIAHFIKNNNEKFSVDVTDKASIEAVDSNKIADQILKASFSYNNKTQEITKNITITAPQNTLKPDTGKVISVKTGDNSLAATFVNMLLFSVGGYLYLRKRES